MRKGGLLLRPTERPRYLPTLCTARRSSGLRSALAALWRESPGHRRTQQIGRQRSWRVSRRRLRENFSVGTADVVGFQFLGTKRLATLGGFPTPPREQPPRRVLNPL